MGAVNTMPQQLAWNMGTIAMQVELALIGLRVVVYQLQLLFLF